MDSQDLKTPEVVSSYFAHTVVDADPVTLTFTKQDGTADAGEIAGTIVFSKLRGPIFNKLGDRLGEYTGNALSTSISFTTGVMDSTKEIAFNYNGSGNRRLDDTIEILEEADNGSWACDYLTGLLIIKKASAGTSQVITTWKLQVADPDGSGGSGGGGTPIQAGTATVTSVASSASNVTLLSANANREGGTFFNDSIETLYLKLGTTASATSYTVQLEPGDYYELPTAAIYTGRIDGIWTAANGNCRITELT